MIRIDADEQAGEERRPGRERPGGHRHGLLARERAGDREHEHDRQEAAREHREPERRVVPVGVSGQAAERGAVVVRRRRERVDDLGEAVRAGLRIDDFGLASTTETDASARIRVGTTRR